MCKLSFTDRLIAYNPAFANLRAGKVKAGPAAAVFLSQLVYWHNRMDGGWIYKTQADITAETALTRDEQETARKRLVALGVLEESRRGIPATMHYRIDADRLQALLPQAAKTERKAPEENTRAGIRQNAATPQTAQVQSRNQICSDAADRNGETLQTTTPDTCKQLRGNAANFLTVDYTEITYKITQEKKPFCPDASPPDDKPDDILSSHPEDLRCAEWFWQQVAGLFRQRILSAPKKPDLTAWANDIRLMRERDGRTHEQIRELFSRINRDSFWCCNVRSPGKLREKWDEMSLRMALKPAARDFMAIPETYSTMDGFCSAEEYLKRTAACAA